MTSVALCHLLKKATFCQQSDRVIAWTRNAASCFTYAPLYCHGYVEAYRYGVVPDNWFLAKLMHDPCEAIHECGSRKFDTGERRAILLRAVTIQDPVLPLPALLLAVVHLIPSYVHLSHVIPIISDSASQLKQPENLGTGLYIDLRGYQEIFPPAQ